MIAGTRTATQLCTTNPELRDHLVKCIRKRLQESPEMRIVSISQNDDEGACECPDCKAIDDFEGSHAGTMITLLNYIATRLGPEFPNVAFDTLAYTYTRKAPRTVRPLPNVIVRLCSIECNFREPLDHSSNQSFAQDIAGWKTLCDRLYIWDYTTDFHHYVMPYPNYFVLGPNVRFFHRHGVRGLFEQGNYQSHGGEMAELRAWLLAQLMWNPYQDDTKLIDEFLAGYYGKAAARPIRKYLDLMHDASKDFNLTIKTRPDAPHLRFGPLSQSEQLWALAEDAARNDPDKLWRVRQGRLPVWYVWLVNWRALRDECLKTNATWPVPKSRQELAALWLHVATTPGPAGWSRMKYVNEPRITPEEIANAGWERRFMAVLGYKL